MVWLVRFLRKSRRQVWEFKGHITALMALVFVLMLSLVGALFESASIQIQKNNLRIRTMLATESVFAEYDRDLLETYDIFARYGKEEDGFSKRLLYYGASGAEHALEEIQLLSDSGGKPFYEQGVKYSKTWMGIEDFSYGDDYVLEDKETIRNQGDVAYQELETVLEKEQVTLPAENNPFSIMEDLKTMDLLTLLLADASKLSSRSIQTHDLPSRRSLEEGNFREVDGTDAMDKSFFVFYLAEHFSSKQDEKAERSLLYELEYLLQGNASDRENLTAVCHELMQIRMLANYVYLLTDTGKQNEAGVVATALCTLISVPEIAEVVKQGILFAWAYGESVVDVRGLLRGNKIPIVKNSGTWCLSLNQLSRVASSQVIGGVGSNGEGMDYQDYLTALLLLEDRENLCMRGLDLIERNLDLRVDCCMTKVKLESRAILRRGIEERFTTKYEYQ